MRVQEGEPAGQIVELFRLGGPEQGERDDAHGFLGVVRAVHHPHAARR